jgi:predicted nucleic acid-binding protein
LSLLYATAVTISLTTLQSTLERESTTPQELDAEAIETLCLSTITIAELRLGSLRCLQGNGKIPFATASRAKCGPTFPGAYCPSISLTSQFYSELMARPRLSGKAIGTADGFIAATAAANRLAIATRDTSPFEATGLTVITPWFR